MACQGISVMNGRIANVEESNRAILSQLDQAIIDKVVVALMTNLKYRITGSNGYYEVSGNGYSFTLAVTNGRVSVRSRGSIPTGIETQVKALLDGLAGKVRQQQVINQLTKAGVKINNQQTAPNGAIVLSVRI